MKFSALAILAAAGPALAKKKVSVAAPAVGLRLESKDKAATASILYTSAGGIELSASKCVDRSSFCDRYKRTDCPKSRAAVASTIKLADADNEAMFVQLLADGTLTFDVGKGCVNPVATWDAEPTHGALLKDKASSAYIATSGTGLDLMSRNGFSVQGDTIEPGCACKNGVAHTDLCMAHEDHHCASCDAGFYLTGKTCTPFTVCTAGEHEAVAPVQTKSNRVCAKNDDGTFTSSSGQVTATEWRTCGAGEGMVAEGTATTDRLCAPCAEGKTYSDVNDGSKCKAVRKPCPAGTHISAAATKASDMKCADCDAEFFSSAPGQAACTAWKTCPAGEGQSNTPSATTDRECAKCTLGKSFSGANDGLPCTTADACSGGEYEKVAPTLTTDRTCATHADECASHEYESQAPSGTQDRQCKQKVCHCPNGVRTTGDACPKHGNPKCSSCTGAYHLANSHQQCDANICSCIHGAVAFGAGCGTHGATKCTSCNFGYHLEGDNCVITPINGGWSNWSGLEACSVTACGQKGTRTKRRTCSNPVPAHGGASCDGASIDSSTTCETAACPINGGWGAWTSGACSVTACGKTGTLTRSRTCDNPAPKHGGKGCTGSTKMFGNFPIIMGTEKVQVKCSTPACPTTTTTTTTAYAGALFTCGSYSGWSSSAVFLKAKSALDCSGISTMLGHGTTCQSDKNDDKPGTFLKIPSGQCATVIAGSGVLAGLGAQCDGWGNWTPKFSSETACATAVAYLNSGKLTTTTSTTTTTTTTTVAPKAPGKLFTCGSYTGWSSSAVFLKANSALDCSDISTMLGHGTTCQSDKNDDKPGTFLKIPSGQCATVIAGGAFAGLGAQCDGWGNWTPKFSSEGACTTAVDKLNTHFATTA